MRRAVVAAALCVTAIAAPAGGQTDRPPASARGQSGATHIAATPPDLVGTPAPRPPVRHGTADTSAAAGAGQEPTSAAQAAAPAAQDAPAAPADGAPAAPQGPPQFETLRESDFDDAACRLALHAMGVSYRSIPAITDADQRDCGIARPVEITRIQPGITLTGGAPMRCGTARSLAWWMREIVVPAASRLPNAPRITDIALGSTYQCRGVVGNGPSQGISEHALGNAIDIAGFAFDDGSRIDIAPAADRGDLTVAFQNAVQGAACLFFATVLGPGSNAAHDNHLHLDIKQRKGGFRLCQ